MEFNSGFKGLNQSEHNRPKNPEQHVTVWLSYDK